MSLISIPLPISQLASYSYLIHQTMFIRIHASDLISTIAVQITAHEFRKESTDSCMLRGCPGVKDRSRYLSFLEQ